MASTQTPNIVLINCDDLGWGDPGCYGHPRNRTPHIDRLAERGIRFTDFYMAAPLCSPSRGAMMTGCYPPRFGFSSFVDGGGVLFPGDGLGLSPDEVTVATLLRDRGYATKLVGKWHCGDQPEFLPTRHGFDSYYGLPYSNDMGRQEGIDRPPLPLLDNEDVLEAQPDQAALIERYVEQSVRFIREHRDQPFFLYLAHMHVHLPHYVLERFAAESANDVYGAAVAAIDWSTGVIVAELTRLGLLDDTLIVFTSDNGSRNDFGDSNGPLRGKKGTTWEGGIRVPCIAQWPARIPAGRVCDELTTAMDLLPTFAAIAGASAPADRPIDGKNIMPLLIGESGAHSEYEDFFYYSRGQLDAVRSGSWKLHVRKGGDTMLELYDLAQDVGETTNVADQHPEVVAALQERLAACRAELGDAASDITGTAVRPVGRVDDPQPLARFDPEHPYFMAMYDLNDRG